MADPTKENVNIEKILNKKCDNENQESTKTDRIYNDPLVGIGLFTLIDDKKSESKKDNNHND